MRTIQASLCLLAVSSAALGGCATAFKSKATGVMVTSNTPGANILLDGKPAGVTPATLTLPNKADATITVQSGGHEESCKLVSNASTGWIVADIFLTTGLGLIVDWMTHNWNNVGPTTCHVSV